ncbi:GyrI-like domain-containing protein [Lutibacter holmesii]|uniref:GyrI-like domain-containing protein n=1 Tax=Lutibacter holmesii TaxID=1137985 RepID=A0ABW3WR02_9FLAO
MQATITQLSEKKLVGNSLKMSLSADKTAALWKSFMPLQKLIKHRVDSNLIAMQVYSKSLIFKDFNPQTEFTKCAMVSVHKFEDIPKELETRILEGGLYVVFIHKGAAKDFPKTANYIFNEWLPNSEYELDQRPHFEVLGANYNPMDAQAEEEVWIPIKPVASHS